MAEVFPSSAKTLRAVGQVSPNDGASLSINRTKNGVEACYLLPVVCSVYFFFGVNGINFSRYNVKHENIVYNVYYFYQFSAIKFYLGSEIHLVSSSRCHTC